MVILKERMEKDYKSIDTFGKIFKAFWHWHMKVNRKNGLDIQDINQDLDTREEKPDWVYLNEDQLKQIINSSKFENKVLLTFLLDTGLRPPLELLPLKVSDLYNDCKELHIRVCKKNSFQRKIKLMLSSELLKSYIKLKGLSQTDYLFPICPEVVNRNLKKLSKELFGDEVTLAGQKFSDLTMYDFRHNSCCYWLPRYKSESALKYRFGWKKSERIHYYSEMLGMKDTISEDDLLIDTTKTELEKRMNKLEQENEILVEKIKNFEKYFKIVDQMADGMKDKTNTINQLNN